MGLLLEKNSYMPGKTREQAFRVGHEIADAVTALNPAPVKLKFEKVCTKLLQPPSPCCTRTRTLYHRCTIPAYSWRRNVT